MKKKIIALLGLLVLGVGIFGNSVLANAGGQVANDGQITFYEETVASSSTVTSSTSSSTTATTSSSTGTLPSTGGKLPKTGETIRNVSFLGAGLLLAVLLILLYRKRKDKEGEA